MTARLLRRACAALAFGALGVAAAAGTLAAQGSTLVFLVRHAEKAAEPAADPPLTAEGEVRARALVDVLANASIGAIISTPYVRTMSTAKPLAEKLGVTVQTVPVAGGTAAHAQAVAAAVRAHAGKAVLVVGHSNTINVIATALGAPRISDLCDGEYDQLFVVELTPSGAARFARAKYGAPTINPKCPAMR